MFGVSFIYAYGHPLKTRCWLCFEIYINGFTLSIPFCLLQFLPLGYLQDLPKLLNRDTVHYCWLPRGIPSFFTRHPPPPKDTWLARILTTTHTSLHVSPVHLLETPRSCTPVVCEGQRWGARPSVRRSAGLSGHGLHFPPIGPEGSFPPPHSYLIGFRFPNFCQSEGIKWYLLIWIWVEEIK